MRRPVLAGEAGFTYIGLLILIAAMGFAMTVVADVWHTTQQREKEEELLFVGNEIRRAIEMYVAATARNPRSLEDLLKDPGFSGVRRFLRRVYRDPITGRTEWGLVTPDGSSIAGVYSLSDDEPIKQSGFSLADQSFEGKKKYSEWQFVSKRATAPAATAGTAAPTAQAPGAATGSPSTPGAGGPAAPADSGTTPIDQGQLPFGRPGLRGRR